MKSIVLGLMVGLGAACTTANPAATCGDGTCTDPNYPYCDMTGAVSGEVGVCIAVTCAPGEIKACVQGQALTCTVSGNGYELQNCELGCSDSPSPHCKYLQPRYLPTACDVPASDDLSVTSTGSIDPNLDQVCTGGVFEQTGAPAICIIHQKSITVPAGITLSVAGKSDKTGRPVAFIADDELTIEGVLDVGGHPRVNGPGGGTFASGTISGNVPNGDAGAGGGAGGATTGGSGGSYNSSGTGMDGGGQPGGAATANPALLAAFIGGGASAYANASPSDLHGGGGGAVMLISCRGTARITGTVNAGGGGGTGGFVAIIPFPGEGGGAGGYVSIEALHVALSGSLFANGGGGGGGVDGSSVDGENGSFSDSIPAKGGAVSGAGAGGSGGIGGRLPGNGLHPTDTMFGSAGGGGGSVGFLQVYAPATTTPDLGLAHVSPPLEPLGVALTR